VGLAKPLTLFGRLAVRLTAKSVLIFAVILAAISWFGFYRSTKRISESHGLLGSDFIALYTGANLARFNPEKLYDLQAQFELEKELTSPSELHRNWRLHYLYPPFFSVGLIPLAYLRYREAYWLWTACSFVLFIAGVAILLRHQKLEPIPRLAVVAVCGATPALHWLLHAGQTTALSFFLWSMTYHFIRRERFFIGGLAVAGLSYRPQMLIMLLPLMFLKLHRRLAMGFTIGLIVLFLIGGVGISFGSYGHYLGLLLNFAGLLSENIHPLNLHISLYGFFRPFTPQPLTVALTVSCSLLIIYWLIQAWQGILRSRSDRFDLQFAGLIPSTLLLMGHSLVYDLLLVSIAGLLCYKQREHFAPDYKLPLALLYLTPWFLFMFAGPYGLNPVQPVLGWLCFEICRAARKVPQAGY
jgi:hypothetical protein